MQVALKTHRPLHGRGSILHPHAAPKRRGLIAVAMLALQMRPLHAEQGWRVDAGPALAVTPQYPGSRGELTLPVPMVDIACGRTLFLNTEHGLGAYAINRQDLQLGSSLWFRRGRFHDENSRLASLGDIDNALQAQLFGRYRVGSVELKTALSRDFGGSSGLAVDSSVAWRLQAAPRLAAAVGVQGSYGNGRTMQAWFGVTPDQARASGLAEYSPGAGFNSVGPIASLDYVLSQRWTFHARLAEDFLTSKASDSPIVERSASPSFAVGATYHFLP
jgi:outer membrane protein